MSPILQSVTGLGLNQGTSGFSRPALQVSSPESRPSRPVGRPRNPYVASCGHWNPGATRHWFSDGSDLAPAPSPASSNLEDLRWHTAGLINFFEFPVLRRVIESTLVFDHGFRPNAVSDALAGLISAEYIPGWRFHVTRLPLGAHGKPDNVYSCNRLPFASEIDYLRAAYQERTSALNVSTLCNAGESYFRSILIESGRFKRITPFKRLGAVEGSRSGKTLDVAATDTQSGIRYGISIKNQREWLYPGAPEIDDVKSRADFHGFEPWLVVPFAVDEAKKRCKRDGIRLTVLGRQIVPASDPKGRPMKRLIERLRCVVGPQPFDFNYSRFRDTLMESPATQRDVEALAEIGQGIGVRPTPTRSPPGARAQAKTRVAA